MRDALADAAGEAVETLRAGLKAEDANTRIRSAVAILDRAWGRPRQQLEASVALTPTVIQPEVNAAKVLQGLSELGLISRPNRDGDLATPSSAASSCFHRTQVDVQRRVGHFPTSHGANCCMF